MPDIRIRIREVVERDIYVRTPAIEDGRDAVQESINTGDDKFFERLEQLEIKDSYYETIESEQLEFDDGHDPDFLTHDGKTLVIYDYADELVT